MATSESLSQTETINGKRYYIVEENGKTYKLPSVTTILSTMGDKSGLDAWKKRVGEAEANRISEFAKNRGTCMHQKLEYWFMSDIEDQKERMEAVNEKMLQFVKENNYTEEELRVGTLLFNKLRICGFFNRVKDVVEMENTLYTTDFGGYAGRVDCIYKNHEDEYVLLDFKTARHTKKPEWITSYYMQLSAYFYAYYRMYGILLDKAELWIAVEDDPPQLIQITLQELKDWLRHFLVFVKEYHKKYDYELSDVKKLIQKDKTDKIGNITVKHFV